MPTYAFIDETDTIIKVVEGSTEILYKKVYCSTAYDGDYFYFMAHELETGKMIQQYSLLYTDCTAPSEASASALKTAVDLIINSYAGGGGGSGTVTTVSVTTANGVSGTVTNPTTTPAISLALGAITPSSVASTGNVTGTNLSGTNTGDNATNTQYSGLAASKQDTLVSGTNIKTIEGQTLLGAGNIDLTKSDVGLSNVDNTSDVNKPVSTAQQTALDLKANIASPTFTGTVTLPAGQVVNGVTLSTAQGTSNFLRGDGTYSAPSASVSITEAEVDFGTTPVRSKRFTITEASITSASKIIVTPSGNVATDRVGDDYEWDSINFTAKPNTGTFTLTGYASGLIRGKRKILYTWQ